MLEQRDRKLLERERELDKTREDLARAHGEQVAALERVAACPPRTPRRMLIEAVREEAEHDAVKIARAIERSAREDAQDKARDIVITAIQRVAADHTAEHTVSVVHLPSDEMKGRIIGREGRNIRALEQATGDRPDHRRHARDRSSCRASTRSGARSPGSRSPSSSPTAGSTPAASRRSSPRPAPRSTSIMRQAGEQAAYDAGVPGLPAEIIKLLGRLKFRTSYGQNVLNHVVETSHLAAVIAAEIGADVQVAKMGGLLHDIGKAVDHEVEGPHAAIGAQIAQRHNLLAQGHQRHRGPPPGGRVHLPGGADRPDRRRHQRLAPGRPRRVDGHLRQAARGPAGHRRELRRRRAVVRGPGRPRGPHPRPARGDRRPDGERLARDIVSKIEEQLTYPGQIKVTVIRETRAVEYAK